VRVRVILNVRVEVEAGRLEWRADMRMGKRTFGRAMARWQQGLFWFRRERRHSAMRRVNIVSE
jgi:hypothetical protein